MRPDYKDVGSNEEEYSNKDKQYSLIINNFPNLLFMTHFKHQAFAA